MTEIKSHRDLVVWQKSMRLAKLIFDLAQKMPREEQYRLTGQMLRAATSVPANIAEGNARGTRKDYANFVSIARGSLAELETLLLIAQDAELLIPVTLEPALALIDEVSRMLNALRQRLANS